MPRVGTIPLLVLLATGAGALLAPLPRPGVSLLAYDTYAYFLPNALHALRSLREDAGGLSWNPYQSCGQPFFGNPLTGLLYPPHLLFLLLPPDAALRAIAVVNLGVAGVGAYALGRELGLRRAAALAGGFAFQLGNTSLVMATWSPMHGGPFAWFPLAMLATERLVRRPDATRAVLLGAVMTCALLPGFPLVVVLMYGLVALRVAWALVTREADRPGALLLTVAGGLALPALLAAVQLLPALDVARRSIRTLPFPGVASETFTAGGWRAALALRSAHDNPFMLVPCLLASLALLGGRRRAAAFYLVAVVPFAALALGLGARWYAGGALAAVLRSPARFAWTIDLCIAVAAACGVDALAAPATSTRARLARVALPAAILLAFAGATPGGLVPREWMLGLGVIAISLASCVARGGGRALATAGLAVAVLANAVLAPSGPLQRLLPSSDPLRAHAGLFERLRAKMSPQDRVALVHRNAAASQFAFMPKSASLFRLPAIGDYEPQASRRWASYFVTMRGAGELSSPRQMLLLSAGWDLGGLDHRLLDLTAARFVVVDATLERIVATLAPPRIRPLFDDGTVLVYENPSAVPRARFVPRVDVVADERAALARLAHGGDDLRTVALVDAPPPTGFLGVAEGPTDARVDFVRDKPTHLVLRVDAPRRGFVVLADQHAPGWRATVNGDPAPILVANVAFRALEVPPGTSTVELRYRTPGLVAGAVISCLALAGVGIVLGRRPRRATASRAADGPMTAAARRCG